jgi:hypothetical protein
MPVVLNKLMKAYEPFVQELQRQVATFISQPRHTWREAALKYTNGFAAEELRRLVDLDTRRKFGAFFTDTTLAGAVLNFFLPDFTEESFIYDPACGTGNLLISVAEYCNNNGRSINLKKQLLGTDIHNEFVRAARLRLMTEYLLKLNVTNNCQVTPDEFSIVQGNGLEDNPFFKKATHFFVNPPFNQIAYSEKLGWANGKVSAASLFVKKILDYCNPGASVIAILPDVLKSGSRYKKWRGEIEQKANVGQIKLLGQFDNYADVDVYAISLTRKTRKNGRLKKLNQLDSNLRHNKLVISDLFKVSVGTVVDNRDIHQGECRPYVVSRGLEGWTVQKVISKTRKHLGKAIIGPFVVIKRTSRLTDKKRAIATIINSKEPTYVDNHLIVLRPKTRTLKACKEVVSILKEQRINEWINMNIRCRHLTVKVVKSIPLVS